jgi:hypothetical protein
MEAAAAPTEHFGCDRQTTITRPHWEFAQAATSQATVVSARQCSKLKRRSVRLSKLGEAGRRSPRFLIQDGASLMAFESPVIVRAHSAASCCSRNNPCIRACKRLSIPRSCASLKVETGFTRSPHFTHRGLWPLSTYPSFRRPIRCQTQSHFSSLPRTDESAMHVSAGSQSSHRPSSESQSVGNMWDWSGSLRFHR